MASGHVHVTSAVSISRFLGLLTKYPGLREALGRYVPVSRGFQVPYGAGPAGDGSVVYIDENTPERLVKSGIEPDEFVVRHEIVEWWLMTRLGWDYSRAHGVAAAGEELLLRERGYGDRIEDYDADWRGLISKTEAERITAASVPPDLFRGPYESDRDALDAKILPILIEASARAVPVRAAG